jgi:hypothetical protein
MNGLPQTASAEKTERRLKFQTQTVEPCTLNGEEVEKRMNYTIREQILAIRDAGETNMFDANMVQAIANREGFYELVVYLEEHRREYSRFILTGEADEEGN